jgi:hypothetical protein
LVSFGPGLAGGAKTRKAWFQIGQKSTSIQTNGCTVLVGDHQSCRTLAEVYYIFDWLIAQNKSNVKIVGRKEQPYQRLMTPAFFICDQ